MRRRVTGWARLLLFVALAGLVVACSGSGSPDDAGTTSTSTSRPITTTTVAPSEPTGTEVHVGLVGVSTLDPLAASPASMSEILLTGLLRATLTDLDDEGRIGPGLASYGVDVDQLVWRFDLRSDATFTDGSPVTADDVVFSLERVRARGATSLAALQLEDVVSVEAVDGATVEVTLDEPSALLPEILSAPVFGIVDQSAVVASHQGAPYAPNPSADHDIEVVASDLFRLRRIRGPGPDTIVVHLYPDREQAADAFARGELDVSPIPANTAAGLEEQGATVVAAPFHATVVLALSPTIEPLTDTGLRRGIALAIDRRALAEFVFGDGALAARGLVPSGIPGVGGCIDPCGPDVGAAQRAIADALPDPDARELRLLTDGSATQETVAGALRQQLGDVGLDVLVTPVDVGTFDQLIAGGSSQQLYVFSTLGIGRTPASHLRAAYLTDSPDNLVGYSNGLVDVAVASAAVEPSPDVRAGLWRDIEEAILVDAPVFPLVQLTNRLALTEAAAGLELRVDGTLDLTGYDEPTGS